MRTDFPKTCMNELLPEEALQIHGFVIEAHKHLSKSQSRLDRLYLRYCCYFILISTAFFFLQVYGIIKNCLPGVIWSGIGTLLALSMILIFTFEYDRKIAHYTEEGENLETIFSPIVVSHHFHALDKENVGYYKSGLIKRFGPISVVASLTSAASILQIWQFSQTLAVSLGFAAIAGVLIYAILISKSLKRFILEK
ncbi:MAG: hypothetical protein JSS61_05970 [Verrucomicrobia bacterium]|nr:hypothetical protein [Verrucomicrobiota bacterium]